MKRFSKTPDPLFFLSGSGEMATIIREYDWSGTSLGPPEKWPSSLQTTLSIVLNSGFPMFLFWGADLLCFYNDAYRPSLGISGKHPAVGKKGIDVWEEIWGVIDPLINQVMTTGKPVWLEDRYIPFYRNGKVEDIYWTFSYSPVYGEKGSIDGLLVTCTETTGKVRMTERLAESEKRFETLVREAPVGIVVLRGERLVVDSVNEAYAQITGHTVEELKGKPIFETLPEAEPYFGYIIDTVLKTGEPYYLYDHPYFVLVDGRERHGFLNIVYQPYRLENNIVSGVMILCQDISGQIADRLRMEQTEQSMKKSTEELAAVNERLRNTNAELAQFTRIASHDLQEPLRKIGSFSEILLGRLGDGIDEQSKSYLQKINRSAGRMAALIRDLIDYSELTPANGLFTNVDLNHVFENTIVDYNPLIREKQAAVSAGTLPVVEAIPLQMSQLFGNLIGNSLKFTRKTVPPVISVVGMSLSEDEKRHPSLDPELEYCKLEFRDNGIGILPEHNERIFRLFQRLHTRSEYEGTGIGLAICHKIARNHGGNLHASESSENGAVFTVLLPVKQRIHDK